METLEYNKHNELVCNHSRKLAIATLVNETFFNSSSYLLNYTNRPTDFDTPSTIRLLSNKIGNRIEYIELKHKEGDFLFDYIQYQFYQILADCKFKTRIDIINSFLYLDKIEIDAFKKHFFDIVNNLKFRGSIDLDDFKERAVSNKLSEYS